MPSEPSVIAYLPRELHGQGGCCNVEKTVFRRGLDWLASQFRQPPTVRTCFRISKRLVFQCEIRFGSSSRGKAGGKPEHGFKGVLPLIV